MDRLLSFLHPPSSILYLPTSHPGTDLLDMLALVRVRVGGDPAQQRSPLAPWEAVGVVQIGLGEFRDLIEQFLARRVPARDHRPQRREIILGHDAGVTR